MTGEDAEGKEGRRRNREGEGTEPSTPPLALWIAVASVLTIMLQQQLKAVANCYLYNLNQRSENGRKWKKITKLKLTLTLLLTLTLTVKS